jgi:hypothetical protein
MLRLSIIAKDGIIVITDAWGNYAFNQDPHPYAQINPKIGQFEIEFHNEAQFQINI